MGFAPLNQCGPSLAAQIGKARILVGQVLRDLAQRRTGRF
jgi:hypothetical protein